MSQVSCPWFSLVLFLTDSCSLLSDWRWHHHWRSIILIIIESESTTSNSSFIDSCILELSIWLLHLRTALKCRLGHHIGCNYESLLRESALRTCSSDGTPSWRSSTSTIDDCRWFLPWEGKWVTWVRTASDGCTSWAFLSCTSVSSGIDEGLE